MKYSMYIGRVGALAVALGIGAAVATSPGIALAQEGDPGPSNVGAESPSNPAPSGPETPTPGVDESNGEDGEDGGSNLTEPPTMNVDGQTVDTGTHDDEIDGSGEEGEEGEEDAADIEDPSGEELDDPPAGNGLQGPGGGSGNSGSQENSLNTQNSRTQQFASNSEGGDLDGTDALRVVGTGADDNSGGQTSFKTAALDNSSSGAATFSALTLDEEVEEANPVASLIALPFRIVSGVLSAIAGGPNTPPGENPLFLGLLAFVRRQFGSFDRTFSNHAPEITGAQVDENEDGTFTITVDTEEPDVDASDPDGDELTFSATDGAEGTVEQTGATTFVYTPPATGWDGEDTFTLTASDPGGLLGINRKTDTVDVHLVAADEDPTEPDVTQPPTEQPDGSFEAKLEFDPEQVTDVTIAEGFEPKYWAVEEVYNPATGELELKLTPTQAGMLRAALGLDTTDSVGLTVTTTETATVQTFAMRSVSFAALAEPDYTVNLPDIPAGHFVTRDPIVTSPGAEDPTATRPAGTVVTDRYAYVLNSNLMTGDSSTLSVIGADPVGHPDDYLQLVDEIDLGANGLLLTQAGDRLYISTGDTLQVVDTDGDPLVEGDDNQLLAPIELEEPNNVVPVASPDGKTVYLINQQLGKISVIDTDPANTTTYHTVVDEIVVADPPSVVDNGDGTNTVSGQFPLSLAFNEDGTRMYLVRDSQTYTQDQVTFAISDFAFSGEIVTIDTDPTSATYNEVIGTPVPLDGDYGYFASSDGKYLYVPVLEMNGFDPVTDPDISVITGAINVIDVQDPDNPVIVANLPTGNLPVNVAFSPDKSLAYVVDAGTGTVFVIDTVNQEVLDLDPIAAGTQGLVFDTDPSAALGQVFNVIASSPSGSRLFVTNFGKGTVVPLEFVLDDEV